MLREQDSNLRFSGYEPGEDGLSSIPQFKKNPPHRHHAVAATYRSVFNEDTPLVINPITSYGWVAWLQLGGFGASKESRTPVSSLEGWCTATMPYLRCVPLVGLEPTRSYNQRILSPLWLPLQHRGI